MEMQQIRYFLSLAETLNFTRAAEECNVSQPSLTRAIRLLEAELGGELLRRERRQSHLTELGLRMLPLMRQCYDSALSARSLARSLKSNEIAPLSIVVSQTINLTLLMPQLNQLSRAYPGIQLKLKRGDGDEVNRLLRDGGAELAVAGPLAELWDRLDAWPIFEEPLELIVRRDHRLANAGEVELGQLAGERFLLRPRCELADLILRGLRANGIDAVNAHEVETDHDMIALLEANYGVAVAPASALTSSDALIHLPIAGVDLRRPVIVYGVAGRRRSTAATTLLNLLRAGDRQRSVN